jgi:SPP1 gp7 family putative phage head morphogenesis protein
VISALEAQGDTELRALPDQFFDNGFANNWQDLGKILSDGIFAAVLLGIDLAQDEHADRLKTLEFTDPPDPTDGGKRAAKAGPLELRFDVPPKEAIDYFERKKVVPAKEFYELNRQARAGAFTVSGVYKTEVLDGFKAEMAKALRDGTPNREVVKRMKAIVAGAGHDELGNAHLENVVRTNMQVAYGTGRRQQMEASADLLPYWQYAAVMDDRTRPTHAALDGSVYPADHPFWNSYYPPWDFRCRCIAIALPDEPAGYNHRSPNADTTISYDDDGMPIKAEHGLHVYDLSPGKFQGIPPQTNLQARLEAGATQASAKRPDATKVIKEAKRIAKSEASKVEAEAAAKGVKRSIERAAAYRTPAPVLDEARQLRFADRPVEKFFTADGQAINLRTASTGGAVRLTSRLPGAGTNIESFDLAEAERAIELRLAEDVMVTRDFRYSLRPSAKGWDSKLGEKLRVAFKEIRAKVASELAERVKAEALSRTRADALERHETWVRIARMFGLRYTRSRF